SCVAIAIAFGACFFGSRAAHAQATQEMRCPLPTHASSALGSHDARARFRFVRSTMGDQARRAMSWSRGWSFFGVAAAGETTALAIANHDEKRRIIWLANGLPALGFPGLILIDPLKVMSDDREVRALVENDPLEEKLCENLARAEQLFAEDAADEAKKTGFFSHALGVLANVASSAVIVIGTGDWTSAILNGVGGEAVSEINLYTLPTGAVSALEKYRAGDLTIPSGTQTVGARGLSFSLSW
ncbi:MAG: hypothetical protein ABI461_03190, partial [Polyangiaceae bacterium]